MKRFEKMKDIYIHYGHRSFDKNLFTAIKNQPSWTKPSGGLWASRLDAKYGWKKWCVAENFRECTKDNSFLFTLSDNANVLHIREVDGLTALPKSKQCVQIEYMTLLDFEALKDKGVDAIELHLSEDQRLYMELYGWDCDSILIMNPDIVEVTEHKTK